MLILVNSFCDTTIQPAFRQAGFAVQRLLERDARGGT